MGTPNMKGAGRLVRALLQYLCIFVYFGGNADGFHPIQAFFASPYSVVRNARRPESSLVGRCRKMGSDGGNQGKDQQSDAFSSWQLQPYNRFPYKSRQACAESTLILVDVENVRGKSGFRLSHRQVLNAMALWNQCFGGGNEEQSFGEGASADDRLVLVIDHGSDSTALYLHETVATEGMKIHPLNMGIVFAGPSCKADDVLANDMMPFFRDHHSQITIVTADSELIHRCKRASTSKQQIHILSPALLLEDMETILATTTSTLSVLPTNASYGVENDEKRPSSLDATDTEKDMEDSDTGKQQTLELLDHEIRLGAQLLQAEAQLYSRRRGNRRVGMTNKRRKKLQQKAQKLREQLFRYRSQSRGSLIDQIVTDLVHSHDTSDHSPGSSVPVSSSLGILPPHQQQILLTKYQNIRQMAKRRKEETGDRVILAEELRRQLLLQYGESHQTTHDDEAGTQLPPGKAFALRRHKHMQNYPCLHPASNADFHPYQSIEAGEDGQEQRLRLVIVSDTHGMEETLTDENGGVLPGGDVLIHLGDFALDRGPVQKYLQKFDAWLASQPHRFKIVLRGNHDPRFVDLSQSGATFVDRPRSIQIMGTLFYLIPFTRTLTVRAMPRKRHTVILSHVPPRGILDRHFAHRDRHCGDITIRRGVERMQPGGPVLWACGHIHEGRGVQRHAFVKATNGHHKNKIGAKHRKHSIDTDQEETLVINAANANAGLATHMEHGPVVVDMVQPPVDSTEHQSPWAELISMDGQFEFLNVGKTEKPQVANFFDATTTGEGELLLAVDLGLRTGVCLFHSSGELLRYENFHFESVEALERQAERILETWSESFVGDDHIARPTYITKIAIEGGDPPLRDAWQRAVNSANVPTPPSFLFVQPEEWRSDLLTWKERVDGASAKAASRLIARQIVADYGAHTLEARESDGKEKFQTDMAESILLALHVARRLDWVQSPASSATPIRRFTNGNIIVPRTTERAIPKPSTASRVTAIH